jgi:hypothetical protein
MEASGQLHAKTMFNVMGRALEANCTGGWASTRTITDRVMMRKIPVPLLTELLQNMMSE